MPEINTNVDENVIIEPMRILANNLDDRIEAELVAVFTHGYNTRSKTTHQITPLVDQVNRSTEDIDGVSENEPLSSDEEIFEIRRNNKGKEMAQCSNCDNWFEEKYGFGVHF
jgi:hypothetical protein